MSRQERIAEILGKRLPLSQKLKEVCNHTQDLISALAGLDALVEEHERYNNSPVRRSKFVIEEKLSTKSIRSTLDLELEKLRFLHERFSKPPLKVAVAGLPKEGKSTFIRAVTGLSENVIPSSKFLCTGSSYTIRNHNSDETFAWVNFYSSNSFLQEVILPYYDDPDLNLSDKPANLESWKQPLLQISDEDAVKETKYKRLLAYYKTYGNYKAFLNQPSLKTQQENEIRQYIAQINEREEDIHVYRAVEVAEIFTKFPNNDVGDIALVDTPGVGELRSKEEEKLVETLRKTADIVICVILPRSDEYTYQSRHSNFFRLMQKGIGKADKRCLLVLNDNGQNSETCRHLAKQEQLEQWGLKFARVFIANCAQPKHVGSAVVDPTLDYLADTIALLDRDDVRKSFEAVLEETEKAASSLEKIYVDSPNNIQYISSRKYREIFEKSFIPNLRSALKAMRVSFLSKRESLSVQSVVQKRLESLSFNVPSAEMIESRRNPKDTYDPAFQEALGQLRAEALKHFQGLDLEFKPVADELKKIIADEFKRIGLEQLSLKDGSDFLEGIYQLIPESCQRIRFAFRVIREFELAYFWLIRIKICQGLEPLLPEKNIFKPKSIDPTKPVTAETIHLALNESCVTAKSNLLGLLGGKATDELFPSNAVLAVLEEFVDLVFYSSDEEGRGVVLGEWQDFLEPYKAKIWAEDFERLEEDVALVERWSKIVEQAKLSIMRLRQICGAEEV